MGSQQVLARASRIILAVSFPDIVLDESGAVSMSGRDRRTRLFLASNERRRYSREREMEIYASACFPLPGVLTSRPLFAQEFYTVVECAEYSNGISTWKMAHNGDNWLPFHVTRRDARRRKPRRREETRAYRARVGFQ